ncbi:DUF7768 domain-containing protein [Paramaledivibacter caminithermalis]|jgi:hypothetical protein|uniref:DUF7768 domain-containing protein n=1 Tax=Paramaledivibacter caminithermalis (strain DSM 15212 / CIP 107654 / DViRD3) TaxID=1121301 RepID=A0A1M6M275_PARC5|nr:DUF4406 domain-containing protein [Paramaledivibacter caminithermalis]SHJ77555.1 hypothetical protein SAMN02745912_01043 [Paramaledivibacter caminithermalis DSM 15212]
MGINSYNHEGYLDLTAYEALKNIEKHRKLVFICSPFAGDIEGNTERARRYGRFAVTRNAIPIIPHLMYPQFLCEDDPEERELGISMGLVLLSKCHELWVFGSKVTSGMAVEIEKAKSINIPIRYFNTHCIPVGGMK